MTKSEKIFRAVFITITLAGLTMMSLSLIYATGRGPIFWDHLGLTGITILGAELIGVSVLLIGGCMPGQYGKVSGWAWALLPLGLGTVIVQLALLQIAPGWTKFLGELLWGIPNSLQVITLTAVLAVVGLTLQAIANRIRLTE